MALPRFMAVKSNYNNKYLRYIDEGVKVKGFLQFSGESVVSPYTIFEVEPAKCGKGLVHIKCCYNKKYWVRESPDKEWIVAWANQTEEDQSKWSCTLFELVNVDPAKKQFQIRHVQLGYYACSSRASPPPHHSCLRADKHGSEVYTIIESPGPTKVLQLESTDIGNETVVGNEIFTTCE